VPAGFASGAIPVPVLGRHPGMDSLFQHFSHAPRKSGNLGRFLSGRN
jgi:hypothetical protein